MGEDDAALLRAYGGTNHPRSESDHLTDLRAVAAVGEARNFRTWAEIQKSAEVRCERKYARELADLAVWKSAIHATHADDRPLRVLFENDGPLALVAVGEARAEAQYKDEIDMLKKAIRRSENALAHLKGLLEGIRWSEIGEELGG